MSKKTTMHSRAKHAMRAAHSNKSKATQLGVAASVALVSTLAIAPIAKGETLQQNDSSPALIKKNQADTPKTPTASSAGTAKAAGSTNTAATNKKTASNTTPQSTATSPTAPQPAQPQTHAGAHTSVRANAPEGTRAPEPLTTPAEKPQTPNSPAGEQPPKPSSTPTETVAPNTTHPEADTQENADKQVTHNDDTKPTYTFKITYAVEGYPQKELLQPTEYSFTEEELNKLSDPTNDGLYIPVKQTKGYRTQRGAYVKDKNGKFVLDKEKNDSITSYIKIDKDLIKKHVNKITSSDKTIISNMVVEYRPKTVTYYIRHMLQDPTDTNKFTEYTKTNETITVTDEHGAAKLIHVTKAKGAVGQRLYTQPLSIEGYTVEENLINSPVPDDAADDEGQTSSSARHTPRKNPLVLEVRYLRNTHRVSYDTQGGTAIQSKHFLYGMQVDAVADPKRKGYEFLGWTQESADTQTPPPAGSTPAGTATTTPASAAPNKTPDATKIDKMPDHNVRFVAHWKAQARAQYSINVWVQKADLVDPEHPSNMDNYDFIGTVHKEGDTDKLISDDDIDIKNQLNSLQGVTFPDVKHLTKDNFDDYFVDDKTAQDLTHEFNNEQEPEYFGSTTKRARAMLRPDGSTVVNKVYNRRTYELYFALPEHDSSITNPIEGYNPTITKNGKEYTYDKNTPDSAYKLMYRFGQRVSFNTGYPNREDFVLYENNDKNNETIGSLGWSLANDQGERDYFDTPPFRFDERFIHPKSSKGVKYTQNSCMLYGKKLGKYQRVLFGDANSATAMYHIVVQLETEQSVRDNLGKHVSDTERTYATSREYTYTKADTDVSDYKYTAPSIEGYEVIEEDAPIIENGLRKVQRGSSKDVYEVRDDCNPTREYMEHEWSVYVEAYNKAHPGNEIDEDDDDELRTWVEREYPTLRFVKKLYGKDSYVTDDSDDSDSEIDKNYFLRFRYRRKTAPVRFFSSEHEQITSTSGEDTPGVAGTPSAGAAAGATIDEPYETNLKTRNYDAMVTASKSSPDKQFTDTYTFTTPTGNTYTFTRPANLPEHYVFAGWSLDPNGTRLVDARKQDGTPYTKDELAQLKQEKPEEYQKLISSIPQAAQGTTLYAAWKPATPLHTIDVDMNRDDAPEHSKVYVEHLQRAQENTTSTQTDADSPAAQPKNMFPRVAERPGYIFNGWLQEYKQKNGPVRWLPFSFDEPIQEDLHIKANWVSDPRVTGTITHVFLREGYTAEQYKAAKQANNQEALRQIVANINTTNLSNLRPRSSYAAEAAYRNGNYYPDHTYSTFTVSDKAANNTAEFIYTPYTTQRCVVHYKDAAGNTIKPDYVFKTNKLTYDVLFAPTIAGYRLQDNQHLTQQIHFAGADAMGKTTPYEYTFTYDDVRILSRKNDAQKSPTNYSRLQFDVDTTELKAENGKIIAVPSQTPGGSLICAPGSIAQDGTTPAAPGTSEQPIATDHLTFDVVKGTKAYQIPLPSVQEKEGYTFIGWTSKIIFENGAQADGATRLPIFSEEFPYKVVYTAHFKKTKIAFTSDNKNQTQDTPDGYYKVIYKADQNGRLQRTITDDHGKQTEETLDQLTNIVVVDKYKTTRIDAPRALPDKGFVEKGAFEFDGTDQKDRTYIKHFEMITPETVEKRYVMPGQLLLQAGQTAKDLIANSNKFADSDDAATGALKATYEFCDEAGNTNTAQGKLDLKNPGEHKIFIKVTAGRAQTRVSKIVPYFYEVMPEMFFGSALKAKGYNEDLLREYTKITFKSKPAEGVLAGKDDKTTDGDTETLTTYVFKGNTDHKAPATYRLDMPSCAGNNVEDKGYHYVFRGWRKVGAHAQTAPVSDFKTFKADIAANERYHIIDTPQQDIVYEAVYQQISYITQKTDDGNVPPDSVVVSFQPAEGHTWNDGTTGPQVFYIKKGMNIARLDKNGKPIKDDDTTTKSILDELGAQLNGYQGAWSKSSMKDVPGDETVGDHPGEWVASHAFQEFVAKQDKFVEPTLLKLKTVCTKDALPKPEDFITNLEALKKNNLVDGNDAITVAYANNPDTSKPGPHTVTLTITVKHKDAAAPITYTKNTVINVLSPVYQASDQHIKDVLKSIEQKKKENPSTPNLTEEEKLVNDNYVEVSFETNTQQGSMVGVTDDASGAGGTTGTGVNTQTYSRIVLKYKDGRPQTVLDVPYVKAEQNKSDASGEFDWEFVGWELVEVPSDAAGTNSNANAAASAAANTAANAVLGQTRDASGISAAQAARLAATHAPKRMRRSLVGADPTGAVDTTGTGTGTNPAGTPAGGNTIVIPPNEHSVTKKYTQKLIYRAVFKKIPHIISAKGGSGIPAGYVPFAVQPAPGHTWQDGTTNPIINYVKSGSSIASVIQNCESNIAGFEGWRVYGADNKELTTQSEIESRTPTSARTFVARQSELPHITPKDNVVISVGDAMPSYRELVQNIEDNSAATAGTAGAGATPAAPGTPGTAAAPATQNSLDAFTNNAINKRFAGWKTAEDGYKTIDTSKPGTYNVSFELEYYTDKQETNADGTPATDTAGKPLFKKATLRVTVPVRVLPRVIPFQDMPQEKSCEHDFIQQNYHKELFRISSSKNGKLASAWHSYWVRNGITLNPNEFIGDVLNPREFDGAQTGDAHGSERLAPQATSDAAARANTLGVPQVVPKPGYMFKNWVANKQSDGTIVYVANFYKLPRMNAEFKAQSRENTPFAATLTCDENNPLSYKAGTLQGFTAGSPAYGLTASCTADSCSVTGTPVVTDWKPGEQKRTVTLHFESRDKFGRESEFAIAVDIVRANTKPSGGHGGTIGGAGHESFGHVSGILHPALRRGDEGAGVGSADGANAGAEAHAAGTLPVITHNNLGSLRATHVARGARLPQTGDPSLAHTAGMLAGAGMALMSGVLVKKKKKQNATSEE